MQGMGLTPDWGTKILRPHSAAKKFFLKKEENKMWPIYKMECYSAMKRKTGHVLQQSETQRHQAERGKPEKKGHLIHDPMYLKCPEQANLWTQKEDQRLSGAGEGKWVLLMETGFFVGDDRNVLELEVVATQNDEHIKCHWIIHLQGVISLYVDLYRDKNNF